VLSVVVFLAWVRGRAREARLDGSEGS